MSYNKARAEKKWIKWKNTEEERLRELGVDEEIIQRLHIYGWEVFKSDRRYYEKLSDTEEYPVTKEKTIAPNSDQHLLDEIEDEQLFAVLNSTDQQTLEIVLYKLDGYTSADISKITGLSVNAINFRMWNFRKKVKNFF